jgi:hypothetical protein
MFGSVEPFLLAYRKEIANVFTLDFVEDGLYWPCACRDGQLCISGSAV